MYILCRYGAAPDQWLRSPYSGVYIQKCNIPNSHKYECIYEAVKDIQKIKKFCDDFYSGCSTEYEKFFIRDLDTMTIKYKHKYADMEKMG